MLSHLFSPQTKVFHIEFPRKEVLTEPCTGREAGSGFLPAGPAVGAAAHSGYRGQLEKRPGLGLLRQAPGDLLQDVTFLSI